jgi:hypothetical protein
MNGEVAQMIALTCHGNAAIQHSQIQQFFPAHSTCQFCESVTFIAGGRRVNGENRAITLAETPDQWMGELSRRGIVGLRLRQHARNDPGISDRYSSGFVGGGRLWRIEGIRGDGASEFWLAKWEVNNKNATDRRIWKVTYGLCEVGQTAGFPRRALNEIADDLRTALEEIRVFSETHARSSFINCFTDALKALDEPDADVGYHKDLFPPGLLGTEATSILKATQGAWVFGGMGSWNDIGFEGEAQSEYERVSDKLFDLLQEAIEAAATSSMNQETL